ncbi:hypothetical protein ATO11_20835 [Pseudaestuariivita atlantica]|uniref:Uncharacterized protein n=1 Tax=Pseudaestuariivita atlantica TaxID=1317121 RepID=A0A0L1JJ57_9RHOB|nr:hypothetical protein ATO11_20835 [Pseudaestuariivita atlantica]
MAGAAMILMGCAEVSAERTIPVADFSIERFETGDRVTFADGAGSYGLWGLKDGTTDAATLAALTTRFAGIPMRCLAHHRADASGDTVREYWCNLPDDAPLSRLVHEAGAAVEACDESLNSFGTC